MLKNEKYDIKVNEKTEIELSELDVAKLDVLPLGNGNYQLIHESKSYYAQILALHFSDKLVKLDVNGFSFELNIKDKFDLLIEKMGLNTNLSVKINEIKAPMPGLVLSVDVEIGQAINEGDLLLVLEAMKMENVIKSPGDGVIKNILVEKGKAVEKGEILIELD